MNKKIERLKRKADRIYRNAGIGGRLSDFMQCLEEIDFLKKELKSIYKAKNSCYNDLNK